METHSGTTHLFSSEAKPLCYTQNAEIIVVA